MKKKEDPIPTLEPGPPRRLTDWKAIVIILLVTLPWWIATSCKFTAMDDNIYVTANPMVLGGLNLHAVGWAFTTTQGGFWFPLLWLSLMLDASAFGTGPIGFHATNVAFHIANTILLFLFLRRATGAPGRSLVAALLFAMHPLRVESVAWVTERKDVLFAFFGLWALLAYHWYARGGGWRAYTLMLLAYACSLMSKSMLVTMPILLLLLDVWPLDRWRTVSKRRLVLEKIPVLIIALAVAAINIHIQHGTPSLIGTDQLPIELRLENMVVSYACYLRDLFYVGLLSVYYSMPPSYSSGVIGASLLVILAISTASIAAVRRFGRRALPSLIGWLWFLIALLPVIGLLQSGSQSRADRFTYFPAIGLTWALVWLWPEAWLRGAAAAKSVLVAAGLTVALTVYMTLQLLLWRDPLALYLDGIAHTYKPAFLEFCAGCELQNEGYLDESLRHYALAVSYAPRYARAMNNSGVVYMRLGKFTSAVNCLQIACQIAPADGEFQQNLKLALELQRRADSQP